MKYISSIHKEVKNIKKIKYFHFYEWNSTEEFSGRPKLAKGDNEKLHPNIFRMILHQNERSVDAKGEGLETASS